MQFVDIHTHLIPGVDDGAEDVDMSLILMLRAQDQGAQTFFATPHSSAFDEDSQNTREAFRVLQARAKDFFPEVRLYLGCEVMCDPDHMDRVLSALHDGCYPTMNGTDYVLTEFSPRVMPEDTIPCIRQLTAAGWKPIIAHLERYENLRDQMALVDQFRDLGCLIQMNVYSLSEEMDASVKAWARTLAGMGKVDLLGTDMHRTYYRPPSLAAGLRWLWDHCSRETVDAMAFGNARQLLLPDGL